MGGVATDAYTVDLHLQYYSGREFRSEGECGNRMGVGRLFKLFRGDL